MKYLNLYFQVFLLIAVLSGCGSDKSMKQPDKSANTFKTKDEALNNAIKSLPELLNANQKKLFGLSESDLKSFSKGTEVQMKYIDFDRLMNSKDTVMSSLIPAEEQTAVYSVTLNGKPRLSVSLSKEKSDWQIQSIGNKNLTDLYSASLINSSSVLIDINGMGITLIQSKDSTGNIYRPVVDYPEANILKKNSYDDKTVLTILRQYGEILRKQFGEKLNKGEIDK